MTSKLEPKDGMIFESGKTYTHSQGLSCCFRQWRATHSHCRFLHGYSLQVEVIFCSNLDDRNWVQDFGGLKPLKEWLTNTFDHKTLVAKDDPQLEVFRNLSLSDTSHKGLQMLDLVVVDHVGCEAFAKMIYDWIHDNINDNIKMVTVREHEGNHATYRRM